MVKLSGWDRAAWFLILLHTALLLMWWSVLPFFVDHYYHLNVLQGFREAGGVVLHDFWEYAPQGRPHLYPPALHLGLLLLDWLHFNPISLARLASVASYTALLVVTWGCARRWLSDRTAYWVVLANCLPWSYLLVASNTVAASWAMIGWLLSLLAIQRKAAGAAILFGALVFYTHLGTPWMMLASWIFWAACDKSVRRIVSISILGCFLLASPWLMHLWGNRQNIAPISTLENTLLDLPVALYAAALLGMAVICKTKVFGQARCILWSVLFGLALLLIHYRFRFFSGQGLLGMGFFAGIGLEFIQQKGQRLFKAAKASNSAWVAAGLTVLCFFLHPVYFPGREPGLVWGDTAFSHLLLQDERMPRSNAVSFYYPQFMDPLVGEIKRLTAPDELIACNQPYACGLLAALSGRAMTMGMLAEVRPEDTSLISAYRSANLLVWFKEEGSSADESHWQQQLNLVQAGETEMASLWRNSSAKGKRQVVHPVMPLWAAEALLILSIGFAAADLLRRRKIKRS